MRCRHEKGHRRSDHPARRSRQDRHLPGRRRATWPTPTSRSPSCAASSSSAWAGRSRTCRTSRRASAASAPRRITWPPPRPSTRCSTSSRRRRPKLRELFYSVFYADRPHDALLRPGRARLRRRPRRAARRAQHPRRDRQGRPGDRRQRHQDARRGGHELISMIGGKAVHPVLGPARRRQQGDQRGASAARSRSSAARQVEFAKFSLKLFDDVVLANTDYVKLITERRLHATRPTTWALVDENNKVNFYDGKIRVVGPDGKEFVKYRRARTTASTSPSASSRGRYLKFPYLKKIGWKGFVDGEDSGVYRATPLSRLQRGRRHGHAAGPGRVRAVLRDARRQAGPPHAGHPLGPPRSSCSTRPSAGRAGHRSGDHRPGRPRAARPRRRARASASSRRRAAR